jgi:hypothetical protein
MFMHALSENTATLDTWVTEMVEENLAQADYHLKLQAKQF